MKRLVPASNYKAGTIKELDDLLAEFQAAKDEDAKKKVIKAASKVAKSSKNAKFAAYYVKAMEKTAAKPAYPTKESTRLEKILKGGNASSEKIDEFTMKRNILAGLIFKAAPSNDEL